MILVQSRQDESVVSGVRTEVSLGREGNAGAVMLALPTSRSLEMPCFLTWVAVTSFVHFMKI